jgi:FMN phosphatase YigB (HAD superfamily)
MSLLIPNPRPLNPMPYTLYPTLLTARAFRRGGPFQLSAKEGTMGAIRAVTFDFHNTLVQGESWLRLEIETLPAVVLAGLVAQGALPAGAADEARREQAVQAYKAVREEAKASGREVSALDGVLRVLAALGLGGTVDRKRVEQAVAEAERACLADTTLIPGVPETLATLQAQGMRLAIVSSAAYPPFVEWGLARHGLAGYFPVLAASATAGYYKTDPRLYAWALARLEVDPAQAVHVGDHPRFDVQGAQAAGLRAVLFTGGAASAATTWAIPPDCRPDATIAHMADLPAALARLAAAP